MGSEPDHLADDVMRQWPATIKSFLEFKMKCVGCPIGRFHTIADTCREHHVDLGRFLDRLRRTIAAAQTNGAT